MTRTQRLWRLAPQRGVITKGGGLNFAQALREAEAQGYVVEPRKTYAILRVVETKLAKRLKEVHDMRVS